MSEVRERSPQGYGDSLERFEGVDSFAQRCIQLSEVADYLTTHAQSDISETAAQVEALNGIKEYDSRGSHINKGIISTLDAYIRRLRNLARLYSAVPSDQELFTSIFKEPAKGDVIVSRLAGGVVFWCEEENYRTAFTHSEANYEMALERAKRSVGVSVGRLNPNTSTGTVPVAAVKMSSKPPTKKYEGDKVPETSIQLSDIDFLLMDYKLDGYQHDTIAIPKKDKDAGEVLEIIKLVDELGVSKSSYYPVAPEIPMEVPCGPYRLVISDGAVTVEFTDHPWAADVSLKAIYKSSSNWGREAFALQRAKKRPIEIHELQHQLNQLYTPRRPKIETKLEGKYESEAELVDAVVEHVLKSLLDKRLRDEFLAKMAGGNRPLDSIAEELIEEVEQNGILYNYLSEREKYIDKLIRRHSGTGINQNRARTIVYATIKYDLYRTHLEQVSDAIVEFANLYDGFSNQNIVSLLTAHPFHSWPAVLSAVDRHLQQTQPKGVSLVRARKDAKKRRDNDLIQNARVE